MVGMWGVIYGVQPPFGLGGLEVRRGVGGMVLVDVGLEGVFLFVVNEGRGGRLAPAVVEPSEAHNCQNNWHTDAHTDTDTHVTTSVATRLLLWLCRS